ncbi:MAG: peroxiredoxin [Candidatus Gastranaerophilales bacterium]|nr:peroxiredoxin [Candidatus Gastranaerophilales bacterium]
MNLSDVKLQGIDENGDEKTYSIDDFKDENVILYFYPKDNTSGCTIEAHNFRDNMDKISKFVKVVGVSPDDIESHKNFKSHNDLNFTLLSDPDKELAEALSVKNDDGSIERSTFLIDKNGNIEKEWRKVNPNEHIEEIMKYIKEKLT